MAAMKARRPGRNAQAQHKRRRPAPTPVEGMPRLTAIQTAWQGESKPMTLRSMTMGLAGAVLFCGAAIAGATWIGGSLFDVNATFQRSADAAAARLGFTIETVDIAASEDAPALSQARLEEVRALIVPEGRQSLVSLDPADVRARVQSLDWVEHVQVRRLWPSTLEVSVVRRQSYARWQEDGVVSVIDANGERLLAERAADHPELPLVVGRGAGPAAEPLLDALESLPAVRTRLKALVRVGERRWNVELMSGATVRLPEAQPVAALRRLEQLHETYALLDRPLAELDLRAPGRLAVRVLPQLAGGPLQLAQSGGA